MSGRISNALRSRPSLVDDEMRGEATLAQVRRERLDVSQLGPVRVKRAGSVDGRVHERGVVRVVVCNVRGEAPNLYTFACLFQDLFEHLDRCADGVKKKLNFHLAERGKEKEKERPKSVTRTCWEEPYQV